MGTYLIVGLPTKVFRRLRDRLEKRKVLSYRHRNCARRVELGDVTFLPLPAVILDRTLPWGTGGRFHFAFYS